MNILTKSECKLEKACVLVVALLILASVSTEARATEVVEDDFNDGIVDESLWTAYVSEPVAMEESDGVVKVSGPTTDPWGSAKLLSDVQLIGDFDVWVDYDWINYDGDREARHVLRVEAPDGVRNSVYLNNHRWGLGNSREIILHKGVDGVYINVTSISGSVVPLIGKLRIRRQGTTFYGYYWASGAWVLLGQTQHFADPGRASLEANNWRDNPALFELHYDNFHAGAEQIIPSGANTAPEVSAGPDLTIDFSEQPYTVIQGAATDADDDPLTYRWLQGAQLLLDWTSVGPGGEALLDLANLPDFSYGSHVLTLEASDGQVMASDQMILTTAEILEDDFNDGVLDRTLWDERPVGTVTVEEADGVVKIIAPAGEPDSHGILWSQSQLVGDFDVWMDYNWVAYDGVPGCRSFLITYNADLSGYVSIGNHQWGAGYSREMLMAYTDSAGWHLVAGIFGADVPLSGKYRIRREGTRFYGYYWSSGGWTLLGSVDRFGDPAVPLFGSSSVGSCPSIEVHWDNFHAQAEQIIISQENLPPVAEAGGPYSGITGEPVIFDGSGSYDPDDDALTYQWDFGDDSTASGVSPEHTYAAGDVYTVTLIVNDGQLDSEPSVTTATINTRPVAGAGDNLELLSADQTTTVILGTGTDADGDTLEYSWYEGEATLLPWTSVGGGGEAYLNLGALVPFSIGDHTLTLEVREVKEGGLTATDGMVLTIQNSPPEAQPAPSHQVVEIGVDPIIVVADVSDFDGDTLSYQWLKGAEVLGSGTVDTVLGGDAVPIPDLDIAAGDPRFAVGVHQIELRVDDGVNAAVSAFVSVDVTDTTAPSLSPVPSVTILWPPNHALQPVTIWANAFDNGGGSIHLGVAVLSSEPPDTDGDGNTIPDSEVVSVDDVTGVIELLLRSERSGKGDGRMYTIIIVASDQSSNQSTAIVEILAPHDKRKK